MRIAKLAKILVSALLIAVMTASICGCSKKSTSSEVSGEKTEIVVFAAASLTETLTELGDKYMAENENVDIIFNFDSSGTLKTQIEEGSNVDIFISAGQKQMNQLDISASADVNTEGLDFVLANTRIDILENKVTLVVTEGNPADISSFDDMFDKLKSGSIMLAVGNSDVPVGQYTQMIFSYYGVSEDSENISCGSNVKEVTTQVNEAAVDCGIIYQTDAYSAGLKVVDTASVDMCGQVIYPAAVMKSAKNVEAAKRFLEYLTEDEADKVFEAVGFTPIA